MFILVPVGLDDRTLSRRPAISIGIAVTCAVLFLLTWVIPEDPLGLEEGVSTAMSRLSFVPMRGLLQVGLLTGAFLHFGWMHLIGNMLFFFVSGPLMEETWGRMRFAAFYLAAIFFSTGAQYAFDSQDYRFVAGASGAVAACMGAVTQAHASARVRLGYFFLFFFRVVRGTFALPAWICGVFWFGMEVFSLRGSSGSGVAVMAHVAGFAFGFVFAFVNGLVQRPNEEVAETPRTRSTSELLAEARTALAENRPTDARRSFAKILAADEDHVDARIGVACLDIDAGRERAALARLEPWLRARPDYAADPALLQLGRTLGARLGSLDWSPDVAGRLGRAATRLNDVPPTVVEALFARERSAANVTVGASLPALAPMELPQPALRAVVHATLTSLDTNGARFTYTDGTPLSIAWSELVALHAARVPMASGGSAVLTDFVFAASAERPGGCVVRVAAPGLGLQRLFPQDAPASAYVKLLRWIHGTSRAPLTPELAALEALQLPTFGDEIAMTRALHAA